MQKQFVGLILLLGVLSACSSNTTTNSPTATIQINPTDLAAEISTATPMPYILSEWSSIPVTDARTQELFTLANFEGKKVYVNLMATWCADCHAQQQQIHQAIQQQATEEVVFVSLSVESGLPLSELATYAEQNGFEWVFAVASPELNASLTEQFDRQVLIPTAIPHFVVNPQGVASSLLLGMKSAQEIMLELQ